MHSVLAEPELYPLGQREHALDPGFIEKNPPLQTVQVEAEDAAMVPENVPASQSTQEVLNIERE